MEFQSSERHACELMSIPRSSCRYRNRRDDSELRERLIELACEKRRFGYRRLHILLQREGGHVNHKRVQRVCRATGLCSALVSTEPGWAIDFPNDVTASGQRLRVFSVMDALTRECLALETDRNMPSRYITRVLQRIISQRGAPQFLRSDNGPEMSSRHYLAWCMERNIGTIHIQPGNPCRTGTSKVFTAACGMNV